MAFTFVCQACEDSFDLDYPELAESKGLKCPNCGKKISASDTDDFVAAIDELFSQVAALRKRFSVTLDVDAEDLPPPYGSDPKRAARGSDDDEDDEDVDDDTAPLEDEAPEDEDEHF